MTDTLTATRPAQQRLGADVFFAAGIVAMLTILFLPIPPVLIDLGLAFSIALSALILMVSLWIQRPLDFSAFPTVLLIATILRLALNIATTRLILSRGGEGEQAAAFLAARLRHGFRGLLAAETRGGAAAERGGPQGGRAGPGRGQGIRQGIAEDCRDRALAGESAGGSPAGLPQRTRPSREQDPQEIRQAVRVSDSGDQAHRQS